MPDNVNSASSSMPTEWQIPGFSQAQMNGLRDLVEGAISTAIEVAFAEQTRLIERTINETINHCFGLATAPGPAPPAFPQPVSWDSIVHEQEQPAIGPAPVVERPPLHLCQSDTAKPARPAAISRPPPMNPRPVVTSPSRFWLRSALKSAPHALAGAAASTPLPPPRWPQPVTSCWRAAPLYRCLVKKGLG